MYKTYDQILSELQSDMMANGAAVTDFSDGSEIQTLLQVTARAYYAQWYMLEQLVELFFVSTCQGPFLDMRVGERGITRKPGVAATGNIAFSRTTASPVATDIPAGTQFSTLDGTITLTTNVDLPLAANWTTGTVAATCTTVGSAGNLNASTALQSVGPAVSGLQTIEVGVGGFTGGVDVETDDALRARYLFTIQHPVDGGTPGDYQVWADEVAGITNVSVFPLARGNGTVDVVVAANGIPSAALVTQVQSVLNANRPVGADAQAVAPTAHSIDVTAAITPASGYAFATLQPLVEAAITAYLDSVAIGGTVRFAALQAAIMAVPGVLDCTLTAPAANVVLGTEELAVPGTVSVTQA